MADQTINMNTPRHIQDHDSAASLEPHWGYAERVVPCTNDPGSCEYLDVVYGAHDVGMIYVGILWLTIAGIILVWSLARHLGRPSLTSAHATDRKTSSSSSLGGLSKIRRSTAAFIRSRFLPDCLRPVFGRTTRLQVVILAALCAYLLIWSFVGITYEIWITPVSDLPGVFNTRSSLGPWSDRVGVLAYGLTPLSVLLASRESLLSLLTGVPYQSFNFLHRWLGYVIFAQSALHTIGWCIVEIRLYQPQPTVAREWITQTYMIWGIVAMLLLTLLFVLSTPWAIRRTGYEFFRKAHYVLAMVYVGACWAHWEALNCFLIPSLIFWLLDRAARLVRSAMLHYHPNAESDRGVMGFRTAKTTITRFPDAEHGDVLRLELDNDQDPWAIGQHFYLCFANCSIWQSHPFTPLNAPVVRGGTVRHSYILRAKQGETRKLAEVAAAAASSATETSVILTGPYGEHLVPAITPATNILCIAGGTGITYVLPMLLHLAQQPSLVHGRPRTRKIELIWAMRHASDVEWVRPEMDLLREASDALNLTIRIYATRDAGSSTPSIQEDKPVVAPKTPEATTTIKEKADASSSASSTSDNVGGDCDCGPADDGAPRDAVVKKTGARSERHPDLARLTRAFVADTASGPTTVFASGPGGMISELRDVVAACNSGSRVWKGQEAYDVRLVCDDRLEW